MQLKQVLTAAIDTLTANAVGSPRMNAETLLMFVLNSDRAYLYAHPEYELTADEQARYDEAVTERSTGKPAQYITGHQEFWGMDLIVSSAVLIPRPETEHVVETMLELARMKQAPRIVDVGTGSGCIALALAAELPWARVEAVDISPAALEVARANAARLQLDHRVIFQQRDLLDGTPAETYDFVVSNPPYVPESEPDKAQREVREFEPKVAVFAGESGLEVYRRLGPQALTTLKPGGWLVVEIGFSLAAAVQDLLRDWAEVRITPDLQGIPRVVAARKRQSDSR
jgi:release factor glutamine methyltransferase